MQWNHFRITHVGLLLSPITCSCLLRVFCLVRRPITALVCVLVTDNNRASVARLGPEINSRACLCVLQGYCHNARCCFFIQRFIFLLIFCLETPKKGSGPINRWPELLLASLSAISFPLTPAWPGTQYSLTACQAELSFNICWHWCTKEDIVLAAWSAFRAAWLSEQILTYFSGWSWASILWAQANITYTSACKPWQVCLEGYWAFYLQITHRPPPRSTLQSWTHLWTRRALWPQEESRGFWSIPL